MRRSGIFSHKMARREKVTADNWMNFERTTLSNGLRLLTAQMPGMRSASIGFFLTVGSRYETDLLAGVSHFIEHMLLKARSITQPLASSPRPSKALAVFLTGAPARNSPVIQRVYLQNSFPL